MSDWAAPSEPADVPSGWAPAVTEADATARSPVRRDDPPEVGIGGPRTPTELVDDGFGFLRRHPLEVVTTAALFVIPFAVLVAYLQRDVFGGESFVDVFSTSDPSLLADDSTGGGDATLQLVAFVGPALGLTLLTAALAKLVAAERAGTALDPTGAVVAALQLSPSLIAAWVAVHVLELVGLVLFVFPGVLAIIAFTVVAPVIGVEGCGPVTAMKRSAALTARRRGPVLGVIVMSFFVEQVVESGLALLPTGIAALIGFDVGWMVLGVGSAVVALITTPFVALVSIELYLDLRVRTEALDIEMRIPSSFETT